MKLHLFEQEYVSIEDIAKVWSKKPGIVQQKDIEHKIWKAYWEGGFIDNHGNSTFVIPYPDKEYINDTPFTLNIINMLDLNENSEKDIQEVALIFSEQNNEFIPRYFLSKSTHSKGYLEKNSLFFEDGCNSIESEHDRTKNLIFFKQIIHENKETQNVVFDINSKLFNILTRYHIFEPPYEKITRYAPLERAFLFNLLYVHGLLAFKPQVLPKWSGEEPEAILIEASEEDYKRLAEQGLNFLEQTFEHKNFVEVYLSPFIKPGHFIEACEKLKIKVPKFLTAGHLKKRGRKQGVAVKHQGIKPEIMLIFDVRLKGIERITSPDSATKIVNDVIDILEKRYPDAEERQIPSPSQIQRYLDEYCKLHNITNANSSIKNIS